MVDSLKLSSEEMRAIGYKVIDVIVERFERIEEFPAVRVASSEDLIARLSEPLPEKGKSFERILEKIQSDVMPYSVTLGHPRFFAFISSPSNFLGAMGDALAAGYNPFVGTWLGGSGPSALELVTIGWLRDMCGLPEQGGGLFTSGGSAANFTALAAARHARAPQGTADCTVYCGDQTHYSNERAFRLLGFTTDQIRVVPSTPDYCMDVAALTDAVQADRKSGRKPLCVVATAGSVNVGAVDDLDAIASICAREDMWFHIDGAYGAAAALSPKLRPLLHGMERADSLCLDPHKWMFQPIEIGCVLVRDSSTLRDAFQIMPDYLKDAHGLGEINFADHGVQLTRGFRALKLWMSLQYFGARRLRDAIEHGVGLAEYAERLLRDRRHWEVITPANLAIVSFRYVPDGWKDTAIDRLNERIVARLMEDGYAMVSSTVLSGNTALRFCTINPSTTERHISETVEKLEEIAVAVMEGE